MLVGEKHLLAANSLFTLTMAVAQVLGLMVLGPISISLLAVEGGFVVVAVLYLIAAISVSTLPKDTPTPRAPSALSPWRQLLARHPGEPALHRRAAADPGRDGPAGDDRDADPDHGDAGAGVCGARAGHVGARTR